MKFRPFTFILMVIAIALIALSYTISKAETYAETLEEHVEKQTEALDAMERAIESD